jgi:aminopeptidase N
MALYQARIELPSNYVLVATGLCKPEGEGAYRCVSGPARDFAMHASALYRVRTAVVRDNAHGDVVIYSYYLPQHERAGENALKYAADALKTYERRFGLYPYRELKVFETTTVAGGIEYPMLAGVTDTNYDLETNSGGSYFEWLVAHEVAHQWWYNMVGSNPITAPWLDEALTQYSASLYIEDRYGDAAAQAQRQLLFNERYDKERKAKGDHRVGQASAAFPRWSYFPIVYGKGPLFFEEVRRNGGDARFEAWLHLYFARHRYGIVQADDLLRAAADAGLGEISRAAYDRWILGR